MNTVNTTTFVTVFSNNMSDDNSWTSGFAMAPSWGNFFGSLVLLIPCIALSIIVFLLFKEFGKEVISSTDIIGIIGIIGIILLLAALLTTVSLTGLLAYLTITTFPA